jgi:hypothetical protein
MKKRYAILGLGVFLAVALAVPALGGPTNPIANISASAKGIANKALKKAKAAEKTANSALSTAQAASSAAGSASGEAKSAQKTANEGKSLAEGAQKTANEGKSLAEGAQKTAKEGKTLAEGAKAAAEAANTNANNRIKETVEVIGTANPSSGTNTTTEKSSSAECPAGEFVLGGGYFVNGEGEKVTVSTSDPALLYGNGWFAEGHAISGTPTWSIQTDVMCGVK